MPSRRRCQNEVNAAIEEAKKDCNETVRLRPGFMASKDVNGDGKPDYILDYGKFECGGTITAYCGSAGCLTQVFASLPDGTYAKGLGRECSRHPVRDGQGQARHDRRSARLGLRQDRLPALPEDAALERQKLCRYTVTMPRLRSQGRR